MKPSLKDNTVNDPFLEQLTFAWRKYNDEQITFEEAEQEIIGWVAQETNKARLHEHGRLAIYECDGLCSECRINARNKAERVAELLHLTSRKGINI